MVLKRFIGDRLFYRRLIALSLPIMIQNLITNFVNMLDNIMVGQVGTSEATGVTIANQLIFVFTLCIFGSVSGAGIFGAQFFGKGDHKGVRDTFRFKLLFGVFITVAAILLFVFAGESMISSFLNGEGTVENAAASLSNGYSYLLIMLIGIIPYTIVQCYSSSLRETAKATPPMIAGVIAVFVNLVLNYVLIFGHFGAPALGVQGAAAATVISRFAELLIVVIWTHKNSAKNKFIVGAYRSFKIPVSLIKQIAIKGLPLMLNETFWSFGMTVPMQCYSVRGQDVVFAVGIANTFFSVFGVAFMSVGVSIGIILGQMLGSGEKDNVLEASRKMIAFSFAVSIVFSAAYALMAGIIPEFYNTDESTKQLAARLMRVCAIAMPLDALVNAAYFTLRSGGKTMITIIFDCGFVWTITVPAAFILSRFTDIPAVPLYAVCQFVNIIKVVLGIIFVERGSWIKNLVNCNSQEKYN